MSITDSFYDLSMLYHDYPHLARVPKEFAIYGVQMTLPATSVGTTGFINIPEDSWFAAWAIFGVPTDNAGGGYYGQSLLLQMTNMSHSKQILNQKTDYSTFAEADFKLEWSLPYPLVFQPTAQLMLEFDNPSALALTMNFSMWGIRAESDRRGNYAQ